MRFHATWAMAVGGMIGGGIYTLAGVLLSLSGSLAWLSLLLGAGIAVITARSYTELTLGGKSVIPTTLFQADGRERIARTCAWALLGLYALAIAVYAFTFAHYVAAAFGLPHQAVMLLEAALIGALVLVNVAGVREPISVQIVAVWIELLTLVVLAVVGLSRWEPGNLEVTTSGNSGLVAIALGGAATFIAFEGFEMLTYDTADIRRPARTLRRALPLAIIAVAIAYALVTLGAASLVGASALVAHQETALAFAASQTFGRTGLAVVTFAAATSAASAINATLFSAARMFRTTARAGLLPHPLEHVNRRGSPARGVVVLGVLGWAVAAFSSLQALVQTASLGFLTLFAVVNAVAAQRLRSGRWLAGTGAMAAAGAALLVGVKLAREHPVALAIMALALVACALARVSVSKRSRRRLAAAHP